MLLSFFKTVRGCGIPATFRELLDLFACLERGLVYADMDRFYYLSRAVLVKDEKHFDKFDKAFGIYFRGLESLGDIIEALIPDDWLRSEFEKYLSDEEKARIASMGGLEKLIEEFKKRLEEQEERHAGGNKWIGTGGTSPFGHDGYNPEGIRVGGEGGEGKAVKVWEGRQYRNLDDSVELGTRNIKLALRRLRKLAREGVDEELDLDGTIRATAKNAGLLEVQMVPEKRNAVKVLALFDVGGSMEPHVRICEELFSAARAEFKHLEYYYFHNFIYEALWRDNRRRQQQRIPTMDLLHRYGSDYKVIFVGDASMAPYEITNPGGSIEHWNEEAGMSWLRRVCDTYEKVCWLNPIPEEHWEYSASVELTRELLGGRMHPLTLRGLEEGMSYLMQ